MSSETIFGFGNRPAGMDSRPRNRIGGIHRCIVAANNDPAMRGRVRLQIPSLFSPGSDPTYWADVCSVPGIFDPPEVGDTGFVMFENEDPEQPIFLGRWWGNTKAPFQAWYKGQQVNDGEAGHTIWDDKTHLPFHDHTKDQWYSPFIRTWTSPTGHYMLFDDFQPTDGSPAGKVEIWDREGKHISMYGNGNIDIYAGGKTYVRISAGGDITISADGTVAVSATTAAVSTTGDVNLTVGGDVDAEVTGQVYLANKKNSSLLMTKQDADQLVSTIAALQTHVHTGGTIAGETGPPVTGIPGYTEVLTTQTKAA